MRFFLFQQHLILNKIIHKLTCIILTDIYIKGFVNNNPVVRLRDPMYTIWNLIKM